MEAGITKEDDCMARLIVSAEGSPLFGNFLMIVSVTSAAGVPTQGLKPDNFNVAHLASLNHAGANPRVVTKATEGPAGFYILDLNRTLRSLHCPQDIMCLGWQLLLKVIMGRRSQQATFRSKRDCTPCLDRCSRQLITSPWLPTQSLPSERWSRTSPVR